MMEIFYLKDNITPSLIEYFMGFILLISIIEDCLLGLTFLLIIKYIYINMVYLINNLGRIYIVSYI